LPHQSETAQLRTAAFVVRADQHHILHCHSHDGSMLTSVFVRNDTRSLNALCEQFCNATAAVLVNFTQAEVTMLLGNVIYVGVQGGAPIFSFCPRPLGKTHDIVIHFTVHFCVLRRFLATGCFALLNSDLPLR
jgi:hypothetical protein